MARRTVSLGLLTLMGLAVMSFDPTAAEEKRVVSVTATGTVEADPDFATYATGVVTEAPTAREALDANSKKMANVIDGLKGLGIAARDIQTRNFNIQPRYTNSKSASSPRGDSTPTISGYQVTNAVRIVVRDLKRLGEVMDKAVSLGANQAGGIQFMVSKAETLLDKARKAAMENALRRAKLYAEAAGAEVGKVLSISEQSQGGQPRPQMYARAMAAEAVPVESGTETLSAVVHVTYELK